MSGCGCGPDWQRPKENGCCATCGGWLPGCGPGKDQVFLVALIRGEDQPVVSPVPVEGEARDE